MNESYFHQETARLRLRPLTARDIPAWAAFFSSANTGLRFVGKTLTSNPKAQAEDWIRRQQKAYAVAGLGQLAVERKDDGAFIGVGGLLEQELAGQREIEVSYSLLPAFWGQGYATEIAQQTRDIGFALWPVDELISIIHEENKASMRVAEKNGMKRGVRLHFRGFPVFRYAILRTHFLGMKKQTFS